MCIDFHSATLQHLGVHVTVKALANDTVGTLMALRAVQSRVKLSMGK